MTHDRTTSEPAQRDPADVSRISVAQARALVEAERGVLVDTRDRRLYDSRHAAGALSLPLSELQATGGRVGTASLPPDRILILYCA